jgi:transposase
VSRYRLDPSPDQEAVLEAHCAHARFIWNLAVEQQRCWRPGRTPPPSYVAQSRQLTEARADNPWLAEGSQMVQQQALRDFARAMAGFFGGTHGKPGWWRRRGAAGFGIVGSQARNFRRLSRKVGEVRVPKAGWVRFRWSRPVPEASSYRVTKDRAGRWHIAFLAVPRAIDGPGTGAAVGVDRGVTVSAALGQPVNREPQLLLTSLQVCTGLESPPRGGEDVNP